MHSFFRTLPTAVVVVYLVFYRQVQSGLTTGTLK
jgi:hypothetical protein